ncbi:peptidoglycan editing factor PgeF [uncultured Erythrobacter sp.]|uniref:peptidoglycan editing factor PgeF n=1 Tax=uncultured Erythrobacter sp. TaxID=263913 RepID=UPI00261C5BC1|nr:peptidoglycan editing factor PgeF [uncultured Erythrobacter sp.]
MAELAALDTPFDIARAKVLGEVPHGFFGSAGGVHQFGYGGPGDEEEIRLFRSAVASAILPGAPLAAPHQVHSPNVITLGKQGKLWPDAAEGRGVADALVTDRPDVVLGIVTADCGPVLFADTNAGVVGAAHAGWRGAQSGVLENTITAMEALGAKRSSIAAALGPMIAQRSYEVDAAFRENFTEADEVHFADAPMREGKTRWHFDLPGYIAARLESTGIARIESLVSDTFGEEARYYSFRRAAQRGEPSYGRQISAIALPR